MKTTHILTRRAFLRGATAAGLLCAAPAPVWALTTETDVVREARLLMGTVVHISAPQRAGARVDEAFERAFARMCELEAVLSRHDSASPLSELNRAGRLNDTPPLLAAMIERARRFHSLTSGAFDPTVTPVLELFRAHKNPAGSMELDPHAMRHALELVRIDALHADGGKVWMERQGMALTLDGMAKGFIADEASRVLHECGVHDHLINAGGDIIASGGKSATPAASPVPWTVGIEHPLRRNTAGGEVWQTLPLTGALATSGSAQMYFDAPHTHHHLINPLSGTSPTRVCSVSVTAPTVLQADALATALSIMVPQDALRLTASLPGVECCIVRTDGQVLTSGGWARG